MEGHSKADTSVSRPSARDCKSRPPGTRSPGTRSADGRDAGAPHSAGNPDGHSESPDAAEEVVDRLAGDLTTFGSIASANGRATTAGDPETAETELRLGSA